jgi:hypothetical protein
MGPEERSMTPPHWMLFFRRTPISPPQKPSNWAAPCQWGP